MLCLCCDSVQYNKRSKHDLFGNYKPCHRMLKLLLQLRQKHVTTCDVFYSSITGVQSRSSGWKSKILMMCLHTVASGAEGRRFTRMTMAMGPAKLQMSLSSMEIQQKSGFPYPSGSRPTARPAAKGEGKKRRRGLVTDELFFHGELGRKICCSNQSVFIAAH